MKVDQAGFLTIKQAAKLTTLSEQTLRNMMADGRLSVCRPLGTDRIVFAMADINRMMRGETAASAS
jgi:excisionase family DNA binding protein